MHSCFPLRNVKVVGIVIYFSNFENNIELLLWHESLDFWKYLQILINR